MYRSGDRGVLRDDGRLSISGRISNREVKLRGYRIDLAELEKDISRCSSEIKMVSAQIQENSLVAFVAPRTVDCVELKRRISQEVPSFSIPAKFVALDRLPINVNGKIDHNQIAALGPQRQVSQRPARHTTPQKQASKRRERERSDKTSLSYSDNSLKSAVAKLWMETLGAQEAPQDGVSFFEAGGHRYVVLSSL